MSMTVTVELVESLVANYTREELVTWQKAATESLMAGLPRVVQTGVNFDSGGHSGEFVEGDPSFVVKATTAAIKKIDSGVQRNDGIIHGDFSGRRVGW